LFGKSRREIYKLINDYSITHISATPTFYRLLLPFERQFKSIQRITLGGEKSNEEIYNKLMMFFPNAKFNNIYASTEAGSLLFSKNEYFKISEYYQGLVFINEENELLVHKSLLGESDTLILKNDFYATGDLVEWIDKERKTFKFLQRKNELINSGGYKINPHEIEDSLRLLDDVEEIVVYGKPNSVLGNILCADVKLRTKSQLKESDIREYLSKHLQYYKIPRKIYFVENVSQTRTGKIKRL